MSLVAGLVLALAAWTSPPSSAAPVTPLRAPVVVEDRPGDVDPLRLARLARYTAAATAPRPLNRDPFSFAVEPRPQRQVAAPERRAPASVTIPQPAAPPAAALPALAGIAEEVGPEGGVRTAVFTAPDGTVHFAVLGQIVDKLYRVSDIGPDRVVLVNQRTGETSEMLVK